MKNIIKKSFIAGFVFSLTVIIVWVTYAVVSNSVWSNTILTASMWNEMAGNYQYKLNEEVNTWKRWINWKPIYRKVVNLWSVHQVTSYSWRTIPHWIADIEKIVSSNLMYGDDGINFYGNSFRNDHSWIRVYVDRVNFNYSYRTSSTPWSINNIILIIEYTKNW